MTPRQIALALVLGAACYLPVLAWLSPGLFLVDGFLVAIGAVLVGCWNALEEDR